MLPAGCTFHMPGLLYTVTTCRLRRLSAVVRFLGLRVRIPPAAAMSLSCDYCELSGTRSVRLGDHPSSEFLPSVVCLSMIMKP
jgi:hypothetical protein